MGSSLSKENCQQVILVGLEKSGKSFFMKKLSDIQQERLEKKHDLNEDNVHEATRGFNILNMKWNEFHFDIWDLGGDPTTRTYWPTFYRKIQFNIVVFFIDLFNEKSHTTALKELLILVNQEELKLARFYIIFNLNCDEKKKLTVNDKSEEYREFAESRMEELRQCPIHDYESRVFWDVVDISNLKSGEIKTTDLLNKCLLGNKESKLPIWHVQS